MGCAVISPQVGTNLGQPGYLADVTDATKYINVQVVFCNAGYLLTGFFHTRWAGVLGLTAEFVGFNTADFAFANVAGNRVHCIEKVVGALLCGYSHLDLLDRSHRLDSSLCMVRSMCAITSQSVTFNSPRPLQIPAALSYDTQFFPKKCSNTPSSVLIGLMMSTRRL